MYQVDTACIAAENFETDEIVLGDFQGVSILDQKEALEKGLELFDLGFLQEADEVLTAAAMQYPDEAELWLAAGICRLHRGAPRAAVSAFQMSRWLSDDPEVEELLALSRELTSSFK